MITIDSQIWIYYWDINALEHENIKKWLYGTEKDGILFKEDIILNAIIPIEVGHHLYKTAELSKDLDKKTIEDLLMALISTENCQIIDIDAILLIDVIQKMKKYSSIGIGGRDTLILATMDRLKVSTIGTHDKNILALKSYKRIDPVFDPPLILDIDEEFDIQDFQEKLKNI
ncbi:MAG: PIN domain-containing protein [Candidatus Lokiarchaeota archaeon]|nr:PIN domain-containing protein [Candidatus Lokiarchaeota archaeon]